MSTIFKFLHSFVYATRGILYALRTQRNMQVHTLILTVVIVFGFYFNLTLGEWLAIILSSGLVLSAEIFNTAIEDVCNLLNLKLKLNYPATTHARNLAAGAVLVSAIAAATVGLIIFIPKFAALIF